MRYKDQRQRIGEGAATPSDRGTSASIKLPHTQVPGSKTPHCNNTRQYYSGISLQPSEFPSASRHQNSNTNMLGRAPWIAMLVAFLAVATEAQEECPANRVLSNPSGSIDHRPDGGYAPWSVCTWSLDLRSHLTDHSSVKISFSLLATEKDYDFVEIRRCFDGACSTLQRHSGMSAPDDEWFPIPAVGVIRVVLVSDGGGELEGFTLAYEVSNQDPTDAFWESVCPLMKSDTGGRIELPAYRNDQVCSWVLDNQPENHQAVQITFDYFSTEASFDTLTVLSCTPGTGFGDCTVLKSYSGQTVPAVETFIYDGNQIVLVFRSDGSSTDEGFKLSYQGTDDTAAVDQYFMACPSGMVIPESRGRIVFQPIDGYRENSRCRWILTGVNATVYSAVEFRWEYLSTEQSFDTVIIETCYDGANGPICEAMASHSGRALPSRATFAIREGEQVQVRFTSDASTQNQGFILNFQAVQDQNANFVALPNQGAGLVTGDPERDKALHDWWYNDGGSGYYSQYDTWQEFYAGWYSDEMNPLGGSLQVEREGPYRVLLIFSPPFVCTNEFLCSRAWNISLTTKEQKVCTQVEGAVMTENGICVHGLMVDILRIANLNNSDALPMKLYFTTSDVVGGYNDAVQEIMAPGHLVKQGKLRACTTANCRVFPAGTTGSLLNQTWNHPCGELPCHALFGDVTANVQRKIQMGARFTSPFYHVQLKLIARIKDRNFGNWFNFLNPFTGELWIAFVCMLIFVGLAMAVMEDGHEVMADEGVRDSIRRIHGHVHSSSGRAAVAMRHATWATIWNAFLTPFFAMDQKTTRFVSRCFLWWWLATMFILTASYTASLTSFLVDSNLKLVLPELEPDDNNAIRVLAHSAKMCEEEQNDECISIQMGGNTEKYLEGRLGADTSKMQDSRPRKDISPMANFQLLLASKDEFKNIYGWVADDIQIDYAKQMAEEEIQCNWVQVGVGFGDSTFAGVVSHVLPAQRLKAINTRLDQAERDGTLAQISEVWLESPKECGRGRKDTEPLKLRDFGFLFLTTLFFGLVGVVYKAPDLYRAHFQGGHWDTSAHDILSSPGATTNDAAEDAATAGVVKPKASLPNKDVGSQPVVAPDTSLKSPRPGNGSMASESGWQLHSQEGSAQYMGQMPQAGIAPGIMPTMVFANNAAYGWPQYA